MKKLIIWLLSKSTSKLTVIMLLVSSFLASEGLATLGLILYVISEILQDLFNKAYEIK